MLRKIAATIRKDLLVRFSSASELLFFLVLPIIFTLLLSGAASDNGGGSGLSLPVVVQDDGPFTERLLTELEASPSVAPQVVSLQQAQDAVANEEAVAMLIIPPDFSDDIAAGQQTTLTWRANPDNTDAVAVQQTVRAAIDRLSHAALTAERAVAAAEARQTFAGAAERRAYYQASLQLAAELLDDAPQRLEVRRALQTVEDDYDPAAQASAGQLITWVFVPLLGTSALFAYERQQGTLRRLFNTPTTKATFLLGAISSQMVTGLAQMLLLIGFGVFVLNLDWGRAPGPLLLLLVAFALASVALGATLGTFIRTERQANGLSLMLGMAMALLGGCWYPIELFPSQVQTAVHVLPTTWAMRGFLDLIVRGGDFLEILPEAGVLLTFALVFFAIGVQRFRYE